jgi:hypothetical protein
MKMRHIGAQHGGRANRHRLGIGEPIPATGAPVLAEMEWEPDTVVDGAAVEERLKGIAKSMPFALSLLGRSKEELIAVGEAMVEEGGRAALLALMKELDAGAADLDALLELANAARARLSSAVANVYPDGMDEAGGPS